MKKFLIVSLLLLITATAFAQASIGIGPEFNMNSRENFAGGAALSFDYGFKEKFAAGVNFTASYNFDEIIVLEPAVLFRWYILQGKSEEEKGKSENAYSGLFVQADIGAYMVLEGDDDMQTLFAGGLRAGYRLPLGKMYIEPYGRAGYPFAFGVGVLAGIKF